MDLTEGLGKFIGGAGLTSTIYSTDITINDISKFRDAIRNKAITSAILFEG